MTAVLYRGLLVCGALALSCTRPQVQAPRLLDGFEDLASWQVIPSDGVKAATYAVPGVTGKALRLDFDFAGSAGYVIIRRTLPLDLPSNYAIEFAMRGDAPVNDLEVKLLDASLENVWWCKRRNVTFPSEWQRIRTRKRHIEFAWGPTEDRTLRHVAALELVIAAGVGGGRGSVYFDDLTFRELPVRPATPPAPVASASSVLPGSAASQAVDGKVDTAWQSDPAAGREQSLTLDLGPGRELGGMILDWQDGRHAARYDVELSDDGKAWKSAYQVSEGNGGRDALLLPEAEARFVRLRLHGGPASGYALAEIEVEDLDFGASGNAFIMALARRSPRGQFPRGMSGEQPYWTVVGVDGGHDSGLLSEDGALEVGKGGYSIEPFVMTAGQVGSWADVAIEQSLRDRYLPIPTVTWRDPRWQMQVTALATGTPEKGQLVARYAVKNLASEPLALTLVLAVRPFQVNSPAQFLNTQGGVRPIHALGWDGAVLTVDGEPGVHPLVAPDHVRLAGFDAGGFPETATLGDRAAPHAIRDATGFASATLAYELRLAPGESREFAVVAPLTGAVTLPGQGQAVPVWLSREEDRVAAAWHDRLDRVAITVPGPGQPVVDTLRSSLAHILMMREGPILRPGTRSYARSWIRDGAMIAEALLRLGQKDIAIDYLRWFAPHQFSSGKVPCCVDGRGADPVPENDSHGQLIFLVAEIYRYTGDRALLEAMWPHVAAAAGYLETLRQSERTPANQTPARRPLYGLLPPSISHEGYSARPAYSYWDDFWGLQGYKDATLLAEVLGRDADRARLARQRDEFRADLLASLRACADAHKIDYLAGAADLGDFDATSTTIALAPVGEGHALPADLLRGTFERYWQEFIARRDGSKAWQAYTPYELRVVGTFVRLGWRDRVGALLDFFLADRRPAPWNQWAEVVGRDAREPRFIGDMPHGWVASDYIRSALDLFAYERAADGALVLAAGIPPAWLDSPGIALKGLRSGHGSVDYTLARSGARLVLHVAGSARPPGGFVLPWPYGGQPGVARRDGKLLAWQGGELRFRDLPAEIVIAVEQPR